MPKPKTFLLPDVGEGLTEAEVVSWHVAVGDVVAVNDTLCDVETAKSVVELPSPFAGVVLELGAREGDTLTVGAPLVTIGPAAEPTGPAEPIESPAPSATVVPAATRTAEEPLVLVGTGPKESTARRLRLNRPDDSPQRSRPHAPTDTRIVVRGVRKATADAMVRSAFTAPHATMWTTVDVTATTALVRRIRTDRAWDGARVSPLLFVAGAVARAVRQHPEINSSWDEATREIVIHHALNLGIAAATPRGLVVPNVKGAGSLTLRELADEMAQTIERARAGKLAPADMSGGTLTLTNVGSFGVEGATPILNPPEAAILAVGTIEQRPWVVGDRIKIRDVMTLAISIDHRLVDGELGANFLRHVASTLHDPAMASI